MLEIINIDHYMNNFPFKLIYTIIESQEEFKKKYKEKKRKMRKIVKFAISFYFGWKYSLKEIFNKDL